MKRHTIKLNLHPDSLGSEVVVDGVDIADVVTRVSIEAYAGRPSRVVLDLDLDPGTVEVDAVEGLTREVLDRVPRSKLTAEQHERLAKRIAEDERLLTKLAKSSPTSTRPVWNGTAQRVDRVERLLAVALGFHDGPTANEPGHADFVDDLRALRAGVAARQMAEINARAKAGW